MRNQRILLEHAERSHVDQLQRRRKERAKRGRLYATVVVAFIALLVLSGPSLISHSSVGRSFVLRKLSEYGFEGQVESMRIGWITPLRVQGLNVQGSRGKSAIHVGQIDVDLTVGDLLTSEPPSEISVSGLAIDCLVREGICSLEEDFRSALDQPSPNATGATHIQILDASVTFTDATTRAAWVVSQANASVTTDSHHTSATFAGLLTQSDGADGSFQGNAKVDSLGSSPWTFEVATESLPLSAVALLFRRFPEVGSNVPARVQGDATGRVVISGDSTGAMTTRLDSFRIRELSAFDASASNETGSRLWRNSLATLSGEIGLSGDQIIGNRLEVTTDFAAVNIDGRFPQDFSWVGAGDNPIQWLEAIDGRASATVDLPAFISSFPKALPIRDDATLVSGKVVANVESLQQNTETGHNRSRLELQSEAIRARSRGQVVVIDPIELRAVVSGKNTGVVAERFVFQSTFGEALGQGSLREGNADFQVDFGRLRGLLRPIFELTDLHLEGFVKGEVQWRAADDETWSLNGSGEGHGLVVALPGGQVHRQQSLQGQMRAVGHWEAGTLHELTDASLSIRAQSLDLTAVLREAVKQPLKNQRIPLVLHGVGRVENLAELLDRWIPNSVRRVAGGFDFDADLDTRPDAIQIHSASLKLTQPSLTFDQTTYSQRRVDLDFEGSLVLPEANMQATRLGLQSEALTVSIQGNLDPKQADLQVSWDADLKQLQGIVQEQIAGQSLHAVKSRPGGDAENPAPTTRSTAPVQQIAFVSRDPEPTRTPWKVAGDCQGNGSILLEGGEWIIDQQSTARNLSISKVSSSANDKPTYWMEPNARIAGTIRIGKNGNQISSDDLEFSTDWLATALKGSIHRHGAQQTIHAEGPTRIRMEFVGQRLEELLGIEVRMEGVHESEFSLDFENQPESSSDFHLRGSLGWERGIVAGIQLGEGAVPFVMNEKTIKIERAVVPVGKGQIQAAGEVYYRPEDRYIQVQPGVLADSIELTPGMTNRWLQYLAPPVAKSADISGVFSMELDESRIDLQAPSQSRVRGRLNLQGAEMTSTPMTSELILIAKQLQSLSRVDDLLKPRDSQAQKESHTLMRFPPQIVDFTMERQQVSHHRLAFTIDRAQVISSGRVNIDGRLDLNAQIPLDERWLGKDLQMLAGQTINLPIDGTLSNPSLDSAGMQQVIAQVGTQAVQETAGNFLQNELNKQLEKLQLRKELEKLQLDKLFDF